MAPVLLLRQTMAGLPLLAVVLFQVLSTPTASKSRLWVPTTVVWATLAPSMVHSRTSPVIRLRHRMSALLSRVLRIQFARSSVHTS
jgi:hypothetical protein